MPMAIGALAALSGVKVATIRFYEQIGLLSVPARTLSNRRSFGLEDVKRLKFIRHARQLGFEIDDIRALLAMTELPQESCHKADSIARKHLAELDRRIRQMTALKGELQRMVDECNGGKVCDCRVIEVLADHEHCRQEH